MSGKPIPVNTEGSRHLIRLVIAHLEAVLHGEAMDERAAIECALENARAALRENARGEWPERYACNGPEGTFWTDDAVLANKLIKAAFDRDEWTVTDTQNPTGATPPPADAGPKPVLSEPNRIRLHQGQNDCPQLMVNDRVVAIFPAGSWAKVCDTLGSITGSEPKANAQVVVGEDALRDARTIYDIACIRESRDNATREDVEFKAICLRNYNLIAALTGERNG